MTSRAGRTSGNPVNTVLAAPFVFTIRLYSRLISPMRPATCRFYPSCSAYAVTALRRFGPVRGGWLAMRRLGRCHPWNPGGVDIVPLTWASRGDVRPEDFRPEGTPEHSEEGSPEHSSEHSAPTIRHTRVPVKW